MFIRVILIGTDIQEYASKLILPYLYLLKFAQVESFNLFNVRLNLFFVLIACGSLGMLLNIAGPLLKQKYLHNFFKKNLELNQQWTIIYKRHKPKDSQKAPNLQNSTNNKIPNKSFIFKPNLSKNSANNEFTQKTNNSQAQLGKTTLVIYFDHIQNRRLKWVKKLYKETYGVNSITEKCFSPLLRYCQLNPLPISVITTK